MAVTVEERVAHVEGKVSELSRRLSSVEGAVRHLEQRMDVRFDGMEKRFEAVDTKFMWVIGIQITTLVAIVAALLSRT